MTREQQLETLKKMRNDVCEDSEDDQALCYAIRTIEALEESITDLQPTCNQLATDCISRTEAIDAICTEGTRLERNGTVAMAEIKQWCVDILEALPSAQPERTCVNCGRTANNGGWYADGGTRCPIEEHYALPKDGYCHLWEKRNVTDDDYPERREK